MKKTVLFGAVLLAACVLAYFGGYYMVVSETLRGQREEPITLQRNIEMSETAEEMPGEYYIARIEQDMLFIYEMPENIIYDSIRTESIHFPEGELPVLREGITFQTLPEVYEFLENSMS